MLDRIPNYKVIKSYPAHAWNKYLRWSVSQIPKLRLLIPKVCLECVRVLPNFISNISRDPLVSKSQVIRHHRLLK